MRDLGLGQHDLGPVFLHERLHFLLAGDGHGAALLGFGLGDAQVGGGLVGLQLGPDVLADFDVGHVDRHDLERRLRIERIVQHGLRDRARIGEHFLVIVRGADRLDDALADAGDDGFLGGAADEPFELGPHGDAGLGPQLNAVAADGVEELPALRRDRGNR